MAYQTLAEYNATSLEDIFVYTATVVPIFIPLILTAFFIIITSSTFFSQKRFSGRGDFISSFAAGSFITTAIAIILSLVENLVNVSTLVVSITVSIIAVILLFVSKD